MKDARALDILLGIYVTCIVASELMGSKVFSVGFVNASVALLLFPLTFAINDMVIEVYGKKRAISFMRTGSIILLFLAVFNVIALALPFADRGVVSPEAYNEVFGKSLRIIIASLTAFWVSERLDILIFSRIRKAMKDKQLWVRSNVSNIISQLFDTSLFMILAFYNPGNELFIVSLIWPYWLLKCSMSVVQTPLTYAGVKWLRQDKKRLEQAQQ